MVLVGQGVYHVGNVLMQRHDVCRVRNVASQAVVQAESEIRRKRIPVAENIFLGNEPTATPLGYCKRKQLYADADAFLERFGININSRLRYDPDNCDFNIL